MKLNGGYTPRQVAVDIALSWLKAAYDETVSDVQRMASTYPQRRELKISIAKLHNTMLSKSGLDGIPLDEDLK